MEQAVFNLIDRNQCFAALLKEATDEVAPFEKTTPASPQMSSLAFASASCENSVQLSIDACLCCIQAQSHISATPVPTVAALECARELCRLLHAAPSVDCEQKKSIGILVEIIKSLASRHLLNRSLFTEQISSKVKALPFELLWQLHTCSAISLDQYIERNLGRPAALRNFTQNLSALCSRRDDSDQEGSKMKQGMLEVLLRCGYSGAEDWIEINQRLATECQAILDNVVLDLLKVQNQTGDAASDHPHVAKLFETIRCHPGIDKDVISRFSLKQLRILLCWNPDAEATNAIARQHSHFIYSKAPQTTIQMFTQLILTIEEKQICSVLREVLEGEKVNWQHTLILVSVFCVCFRQGFSHIKELVSTVLRDSFESFRPQLLYAAFLLARQAAAERSHDFPCYAQWFKDQFGTATGPHYITSSKTFAFFMEFLNSLVPHEPVHCLKAHLQHQPCFPSKSRDYMDYIALARTRLADFKESWQTSDAAGPSNGSKMQMGKQSAMEDVEVAVAQFEKTSCIPGRVLQSSIFQRPYYIGQFLPALLTPRMLPDVPDSRMKFIEALKSDVKISLPMYKNYIEACAVELKTLLEGVSSEDMDDLTVEPMDHLQDCLDSLPHLLMKESSQASYQTDIAGHISLISGRVTAVLEGLNIVPANVDSIEGAEVILLEVTGGNSMEPTTMRVTDMLLSIFCKSHMLMVKAKRPCTSLMESFASMLATQGSLINPLYHRLFTLICHQGTTLSEDHIMGLSSLLTHMTALGERFPLVKLQTPVKHIRKQQNQPEPCQMPLLNLICENLEHHTGTTMLFTLRFCTAVLDAPDISESSQVVPQVLKQKFCYLRPRLDPTSRLEFVPDPVQLMTFEKWLRMELGVHQCQDCLSQAQRKTYHHWALYTQYIPHLMQSSCQENSAMACKRASTYILNALLDWYAEPARKTSKHCPHEAGQGQCVVGACGCLSSCQEVIQLLQELLTVWSPTVQQKTPSVGTGWPWLLEKFDARLMKLSALGSETDASQLHELSTGLEVFNQMTLAQCLPPHLLLTDSLRYLPTLPGLKLLTSYINTNMREHLQDEFCTLGYEVVSVILQGFLQLYMNMAHRAQDVVTATDRLLQECPIFTLSVLIHWNMLAPLIGQLNVGGSNSPRLLAMLTKMHTLVSKVCSTESGTSLASAGRIQEHIVIISSVAQLVQRAVLVEDLTSLQQKLVQKLGEIFKEDEIRRCLFEYLVARLAWFVLTRPPENQRVDTLYEAAEILLSRYPSGLTVCRGNSVFRRDFLQQSVYKLYPVVCFRMLQSSHCLGVLQLASTDPQLLMTILQLYTSLVNLHCRTEQPITELPGHPATHIPQVVDLEFLQSSLTLVRKVITDSSSQTLASVDGLVLAGTDPEVRSMIVQRLQ